MRYFPIKAFGVETQVPAWAASTLAAVLVAGLAWTIYDKVYLSPEHALVSLKDANKQLEMEVEEYSLHAMEEPEKHELFEDQDGKLILRVFKDHCVLIQRQTRQGVRTKLVMDLARTSAASRLIMPPIIHLFLLVFAVVCFVLATWGPGTANWNRLVSAGLAFLAASFVSW